MYYRLLSYTIAYPEGKTEMGLVPFKGEDCSEQLVNEFVAKYLEMAGIIHNGFQVEHVKTYDNEHEWIIDVHQKNAFQQLQMMHGYAEELLDRYGLPKPAVSGK